MCSTIFSVLLLSLSERNNWKTAQINMPRQPVRFSNRTLRKSCRSGQRNGERGKGSSETETDRNFDKMLALRVRWRGWERERDIERQICELPRPFTLYRGSLWGPVTACLNTQTPNSSEVCGQDGSELRLQGKFHSAARCLSLIHTLGETHLTYEYCTLKSSSFREQIKKLWLLFLKWGGNSFVFKGT